MTDENYYNGGGSTSSIISAAARERSPVGNKNNYHFSSYSKWYDVLFMILGTVLAIVAGICLPVIYYLLGRAITEFTDYTVTTLVFNQSIDYFCVISNESSSPVTAECFIGRVASITYFIIGLAVILFLTTTLSNILWTFSALNQTKLIRKDFLNSVMIQDVEWYDINPPLLLPSLLINDIQKIEDGTGDKVANFIKEFTTLLAGLVVAFILNWKITLAISVFMPLLLIVIIFVGKILVSVTRQEQTVLANAGAVAEEALTLIKTIIAFGGERKEEERYINLLKKAKTASYKKQLIYGILVGFFSFIIFAVYGLGIWYGAIVLTNCDVSAGTIFTILFEIAGGCLHINEALPLFASIVGAISAKYSVYSIINQVRNCRNNRSENVLKTLNGQIRFSDVLFAYPSRPDVPIFHGLNLIVEPGQTVALVGSSGSGKSTILQLLQCIYTPNQGMITIDGIDINDINVNWLRNQIGIVSQEPVLFNVSIGENISYGKEGATTDEIEAAAKYANVYSFISELPQGFNTMVGDGGAQLSGGQKQRIAIARALIRNPKILLLDEATSALDTESEKVVQEALDKARVGRTTIIIAHRLSTIYNADLIATVKDGHIVEIGTHNELLKNKKGLYTQLVQNQKMCEKEDKCDDFNQAYRRSLRRQRSKKLIRKVSAQLPSLSGSKSFVIAQTPLKPDKGFFKSISRRVSENLITVAELPHSPNVTSAHMSSFDEDDVFYWPDDDSPHMERKTEAYPVPWRTLVKLSKPDWWLLLLGMIGFILVGVLLSAIYVLFSNAVKVYTETNRTILLEEARKYFVLYIACGIGSFILHFVSVFCIGIASDRLTNRLREQTFKTIMRQDVSFFDEPDSSVSVLTQRLTIDASRVNQVTGILMGITIRGIVNVIAGFVIALQAAWVLGLVSLLSVVLFVFGGVLQLKLTNIYTTKSQLYKKESIKTAVEVINNIYTVASLGIHERLLLKFHKQLGKPYWYDVKSSIVQAIFYALVQSFLMILMAAILNLGAVIYTLDQSSIYYADFDQILKVAGVMFLTSLIFNEIYRGLPDTQSARIAANNILTLLSRERKFDKETGLTPMEKYEPSTIKFREIEFSYPSRPDVNVLQRLNVCVKHGTTLALVGPSGSGKSTVIELMERFYNISRGSLSLDSDDVHELNISWLRCQMSLVSQEPDLFDMSIADNIRYGALYREVSDQEVTEAAVSANIHDFIITLPQGYETNVGCKGAQLSGGQKQRIAIARALIRNPKILLLDEATSALDTESEKVVQEALDKARVGRTTIIIAHRLSTIYNADSIAVLHKGRVVEQGTHSELMKRKGAYFFMNQVNKD